MLVLLPDLDKSVELPQLMPYRYGVARNAMVKRARAAISCQPIPSSQYERNRTGHDPRDFVRCLRTSALLRKA